MAMAEPEPKSLKEDMAAPLSKLTLDTSKDNPKSSSNKNVKKKPKKLAVADSWEDEDLSSDDESDARDQAEKQEPGSEDLSTPSGTSSRHAVPSPPPPTPNTPSAGVPRDYPGGSAYSGNSTAERERRPEKTDAVARRMIAAGLGLKAPKQTEEQKEYQRSIREQEKKRREQERAEEQKRKEDAERAKAAIWDD